MSAPRPAPQSPYWFARHPAMALALINLALLGLVELLLQAGLGERLRPRVDQAIANSRELHHSYIPGARFTRKPDPGDDYDPVLNEINALGIRGPMPGPKRGTRVLVLGDSTIQADEIPFDRTFSAVLTRRLEPEVEFIAQGVLSWSPTIQLSWLGRVGAALEPDIVLLFLDANDFMRASVFDFSDETYRRVATYDRAMPIAYDVRMPSWRTTMRRAARRSEIVRLLDDLVGAMGTARQTRRGVDSYLHELQHLDQPREAWPEDLRRAVDGTLQAVYDIHTWLLARNVGLAVLMVPSALSWTDEADLARATGEGWDGAATVANRGLETYLTRELASAGIEWVALRPHFERVKTAEPGQRLFLRRDTHWNARAHALVADVLSARFGTAAAR